MSENHEYLSNRRIIRIVTGLLLGLMLLARIGYGQIQTGDGQHVILQGSIHVQPVKPVIGDQTGKIQPGTPVKIIMTVENKGQQASPPAELYVRYGFSHPLDQETKSVIFNTEKKQLPTIAPGKKLEMAFETYHHIPALLDFVRDDWPMREYQAIATVHEKDHLIGSLAIAFSAYYYPGIKQEFPTKIFSNTSH